MTTVTLPQTAAVIGKLQERQEAREKEREERQQAAQQDSDPREDVNGFLSRFNSGQRFLREQLQQADGAAAGGAAKEQVLQQLEHASHQITQLEQATSAAAYFLPPYELRSSTAALQELRSEVAAIKQQLQPKKKFAFSKSAVVRTATGAAPSAHAAAAAEPQAATGSVHADSRQPWAKGSAADPQQELQQAAAAPPPSAHDLQLVASGHGCIGLRGCTVVMAAEQLSGQGFVLHDLRGCTVFLLGAMSALRLQQLVECRVVTGPVSGSTFISSASNCTFMLASHQVRIHDARQCDFYLRVRSRPIIEHSRGLRFAPYLVEGLLQQQRRERTQEQQQQREGTQEQQQQWERTQEQQQQRERAQEQQQDRLQQGQGQFSQQDKQGTKLAELFAAAQLLEDRSSSSSSSSLWQQVDDFGWVKAAQSPNWSVLPEGERLVPLQPPAAAISGTSPQCIGPIV